MTDEAGSDGDRPERPGRARRLAGRWVALRHGGHPSTGQPAGRSGSGETVMPEEADPQIQPAVAITSAFTRAEVPYGVNLAAGWAWRVLVIAGAVVLLALAIAKLSVLVIPLVIATLLTALVEPAVGWLGGLGLRRGLASLLVVLLTLVVVSALVGFAGHQVAGGADDLRDSAVSGLKEIRSWLHTGPLQLSNQQLSDYFQQAEDGVRSAGSADLLGRAGEVGSVFADAVAGFFIVVLTTYFFLADGALIWAFLVRLMPRAARERTDSSGRVAWISLTRFVHATVIVAAVDAALISVGALVLGVPFVAAIGVLVFLGAFVPILGATVAGAVATLVALVDQGFVTALIMFGVVIAVNQIESHGLQPFLMGRWVRLHPLGVIFAIGTGVILAGIPGALVAVPFTAAANAVGQHLAGSTRVGGDPAEHLEQDYAEQGRARPERAQVEADAARPGPGEQEA